MAKSSLMPMPGFRFHPTAVELVMYFLKRKLLGKKIPYNVVAEVNIYDFSPWDLPDKSPMESGDLEWYFFCPTAKKYSTGGRSNRATTIKFGYWKATGLDRTVKFKDRKFNHSERTVATIKTLVFHQGPTGKGQRTNWVMHEYRMGDEQLATAGIVQDAYVLCKIFQKSGSGPKNGAQYGAPFNEEEWDDDVVSSLDSQAIFGPLDGSITMDHKQKGPAITNMTEPGSSSVTYSANEHTNTLNHKQKGPATTNVTEPGSSSVMFSANEPLNYKQKGPATISMTEPGSSIVTNEPINSLDYKPATTDMTRPQITHGLSVTKRGSSSGLLLTNENNEMPTGDDVMFLADLDTIMEAPEEAANEDDGIYGNLENLFNLEDFDGNDMKTDEADYMPEEFPTPDDDLGLGEFFVD